MRVRMTPERWEQVNELFHSALEREPDQRAAFLDQACDGDHVLRGEVESLIESHEKTSSFIDEPPIEAAARVMAVDRIDLTPGQRIGHYTILSLLGSGGMGDVYLAQDSRLGRKLALKLLPADFTKDKDRVRRFEQEARAASALNHPNILTIFDIEEVEGRRLIATEYIEGKTLREYIADKKLELNEALDLALQVASALSAAHKAGIVHRDIKPENIMLRPDGYAKVLDFGLAKLTDRRMDAAAGESRAFVAVQTDTGMPMGTASYMSPEQAKGQPVDQRSDVFSFGVVLYEIITGQMAFRRDSAVDTLHAIIHDEPEGISALRGRVPAGVEEVLRRCLAKKSEERYSNGEELVAVLKQATAISRSTTGMLAHSPSGWIRRHRTSSIALAVIILLVGAVLARWVEHPTPKLASAASPLTPMEVKPFTSYAGAEFLGGFSPDGTQIAFGWTGEKEDNGTADIYVKQIGAERPLRLTTSVSGNNVCSLWSPDGKTIAFIRYSENETSIITVPILGGAERKLLTLSPYVPFPPVWDWSPNGKLIAFSDLPPKDEPRRITLVSLDTMERHLLTTPTEDLGDPTAPGDSRPAFSPDGRYVAFIRQSSLISWDIYIVPVTGGEPRRLTFDKTQITSCAWTPDGREIIFSSDPVGRNGCLWRIPASGGVPQRIAIAGYNVLYPRVSRQGNRLAYVQQSGEMNIYRVGLSGAMVSNPPTKLIASTRNDSTPQFSPDGRRIAFESDRSGPSEIWICDSDGSNALQLTFLNNFAGHPRWSPDGQQIAFFFFEERRGHIYVARAEGGPPRPVTNGDFDDFFPTWSSDGKWLYFSSNRTGAYQLWRAPAQGGEAVQMTRQGGYSALESPDGKYVYYVKGPPAAGIWRMPAEGGEELQILDSFMEFGHSAIVSGGIYFANRDAKDVLNLEFLDFATRKVRKVSSLGKLPISDFAVSPDLRQILYTRLDHENRDIMLIENFR